MLRYHFTNKDEKRKCRICGTTWTAAVRPRFPEGIGAVCDECLPLREKVDLIAQGLVRNITTIGNFIDQDGMIFEAFVDGEWVKYGPINMHDVTLPFNGQDFPPVPVSWWELHELFKKHGDVAGETLAKGEGLQV